MFDWSGGGNTIRLWAKDAPPRIIEGHPPSPVRPHRPGPAYEAVIGGLVPGKEYAYEVGNPARPVPLSFRRRCREAGTDSRSLPSVTSERPANGRRW